MSPMMAGLLWQHPNANQLGRELRAEGIDRNNDLLGRVVNFLTGVRGVDAAKGAETLNYLAASPEVEGTTGRFLWTAGPCLLPL